MQRTLPLNPVCACVENAMQASDSTSIESMNGTWPGSACVSNDSSEHATSSKSVPCSTSLSAIIAIASTASLSAPRFLTCLIRSSSGRSSSQIDKFRARGAHRLVEHAGDANGRRREHADARSRPCLRGNPVHRQANHVEKRDGDRGADLVGEMVRRVARHGERLRAEGFEALAMAAMTGPGSSPRFSISAAIRDGTCGLLSTIIGT